MKDNFKKQPKTHLIHAYMSKATYDKLIEMQNHYHLSISAMCTITLEKWQLLTQLEQLQSNYLDESRYKNQDTRTCIKCKYFREHPLNERIKETTLASNVLYLLANDLKPFFKKFDIKNDKEQVRILNQIKNEFSKQKDLYWNFNQQYRCNVRARKQLNKEYPTT